MTERSNFVFPVIILWVNSLDAGKKELPSKGNQYYSVAKILNNDKAESWSIEFTITQQNIDSYQSEANARFLFETAPISLIQSGFSFDIFEGPYKVAQVKCL